MERVKIVVYSQSLIPPAMMSTLLEQLEKQKATLDSEVVRSPEGILAAVESTVLTVLILTLQAKEELVDLLNVLTMVDDRIKSGNLRSIILNGVNHPRVIGLMKTRGAHDIIDYQSTIKAVNHKIKTAFMVVTQNHQRNQSTRNSGSRAGNEGGGSARENRNDHASNIRWLKPVEHPSDFWYVPHVKNLRFVMGRWLVDVLGPGPAAGFWEELKSERQGERGWVWKLRVQSDTEFQPRQGRWIFYGKQPEFSWQRNLWSFVSTVPFLAFYTEDEQAPEFVRFGCVKGKELEAFENSEVSKLFVPKIQASLEASMKLSKNEIESMGYGSTGPSDSSHPEWNDHEGAVGFEFKPKDLRVETRRRSHDRKSPLDTNPALGEHLGLKDVAQPGVSSGKKTFEKIILEIRMESLNGLAISNGLPLRVIELSGERATFEFPRDSLRARDRLLLGVRFRLGEIDRRFSVEWSGHDVQGVEGAGMLAVGNFTGKGQEELRQALFIFDRREAELKDFFTTARGA
ncbi:MAG: hypothetical protein H7301_07600 [Cryobacterium sp.]|nr:hypothetical protein [Oligoflexia bacterium]